MSELVADYDVKLRYKDDSGVLHHINRKSKKGGDNLRKATASLETLSFYAWLDKIQADAIRKLYEAGLYDHLIGNLRRHFIETNGLSGISRSEALQRYKYLYSFLSKEQLENRKPTFDNFSESDLNISKLLEEKKL